MLIDFAKLAEPFPSKDVEWRLAQCGETQRGFWAKCLAYLTNRAIMQRLDDVCGPENWKNEFSKGPDGGVVCGISIRVESEWVTKWDGAENTEVESIKGGLSDSMKRAAVQWGIGRYLYGLEEGWANIVDDSNRDAFRGQTKDKKPFRWMPPQLPDWALPKATPAKTPAVKTTPSSNGNGKHEQSQEFAAFSIWMATQVPVPFKTKAELWAEVLLNAGPDWTPATLPTCPDKSVFNRIMTVISERKPAAAVR